MLPMLDWAEATTAALLSVETLKSVGLSNRKLSLTSAVTKAPPLHGPTSNLPENQTYQISISRCTFVAQLPWPFRLSNMSGLSTFDIYGHLLKGVDVSWYVPDSIWSSNPVLKV
ncbi:hypothetical protein V6N13_147695 [Hibiscus sabdariffa]